MQRPGKYKMLYVHTHYANPQYCVWLERENFCTYYGNALCFQGTLKRRDHLKESKFFDCTCVRCSDPTELGTYAGALKCPQCSTGVVLSTAPLDRDADWHCNNTVCTGYTVSARSVRHLIDKWDQKTDIHFVLVTLRIYPRLLRWSNQMGWEVIAHVELW